MAMYAGADWLRDNKSATKQEVSDFGAQVADLLGYAFQGIYHISAEMMKADFSNSSRVEVILGYMDLATYDANTLTLLVFLAHRFAIRFSIAPASPRYLRLVFHRRQRNGRYFERHLSLQEAVLLFESACDLPEVKGG